MNKTRVKSKPKQNIREYVRREHTHTRTNYCTLYVSELYCNFAESDDWGP